MYRIRALNNMEQIQSIEYADRAYGIQEMSRMYPDYQLEITDMVVEAEERRLLELSRPKVKIVGADE